MAFISEFYECLFGLERVWKRGNANDVSYGFDAIFSSYRRAVARSEESMLFVFLFPLSHEIENPDVNTSCEEKWTAISSSVFRKIMNTNFSRTKSSVRVQERHCKKFFNKKNLKKNIYNILRIKILFLEPKLFLDPPKLFILFSFFL